MTKNINPSIYMSAIIINVLIALAIFIIGTYCGPNTQLVVKIIMIMFLCTAIVSEMWEQFTFYGQMSFTFKPFFRRSLVYKISVLLHIITILYVGWISVGIFYLLAVISENQVDADKVLEINDKVNKNIATVKRKHHY
jgi:uncharacterized membrane protein YciS (DUF1049 family)